MAKQAYKPVQERREQNTIVINIGALVTSIEFKEPFTDDHAKEIKDKLSSKIIEVLNDLR